jgi:hypothetical protein
MTIREQIITALDTRFTMILQAGGYNTNLGTAVYHWQTENIPEDACPALVYHDPKETVELASLQELEHTIALEIALKYAVSDIADVYGGIEDVMTLFGAINAVNDLLGQLLVDVTPTGNEINIDISGQTIIVTAGINIDVIYRSRKWEI